MILLYIHIGESLNANDNEYQNELYTEREGLSTWLPYRHRERWMLPEPELRPSAFTEPIR